MNTHQNGWLLDKERSIKMPRKGIKQKGQFNIQSGMAFTMSDMPDICKKYNIGAEQHPWLILRTEDDYVEIIMCSTLWSNKEDKHNYRALSYDNTTDITNTCPPLDRTNIRGTKVSFDTFMMLKKKDLFSHEIKICNENTPTRNFTTEGLKSLCLSQNDRKNIRKETLEYTVRHPEFNYDPYNCENAKELLTEKEYQKQFGWQHIKPANPYAIYPFEDQMYDYEKQDPELVKIARLKKQAIQKQKRKQQADDKFGHIQANSPNTELGLGE